jgi:diguanylate cyclase (GGDEF)-like protein
VNTPSRSASTSARVMALAVSAAAASFVITITSLAGLRPLVHLPGIGLVTMAAAFALAEALPVHFEHRREAVSITLSTVPLVVGLFAMSPVVLIGARLAGSAITLVLHRRQRPLKLSVNLASFWMQTAVSVVVFRALQLHGVGPRNWPGAFAAVLIGDIAQSIVLTSAISLYQRRWEASLVTSALVSIVATGVETSLGIVALSLWTSQPAALLPLGVVTALVLLSYQTHRSLGERHRELGHLYDFTSVMGDALLDGRVIEALLERARDLMHAERAWIDHGQDGLHAAACAAGAPLRITAGDSELGHLVLAAGAREILAAPLFGGSGPVGTLVVADRSGSVRGFDKDDLRLFATIANHAGVSMENDLLVERLRVKAAESEHQSLHDSLTGLPNRVLFARRLEDAVASDTAAAVLLLDLDRFKEVNDTLGHHNGDLLLQQVGDRLRGTLRRGDVIARLGGDEFAVLLPDIQGEHAALHAALGIVDLLEQPFLIGDMSVDVGASIGIAVSPRDGVDAVTLVQRADVAMYTAKADQTGVEMYRPERDGYSPERLTLVSELRQAVQEDQLEVFYQPQVDLRDGTMFGAEALVRWFHPTRGIIHPDEFISVAEHTGLIRPLTLFVLDEALAALRQWRHAGHPLRISVNLSARSLLQPELVDDVAALLKRHGVPAGGLCLEVTESSIMCDPRRTTATLEGLRALGVTIAVDDFGTGHSSLAYIKRLPVGEIKIDKSFVLSMLSDHSDEMIVGTILHLGQNLGISVVAEGVEDEASRDRLQEMGCPAAQGYLFGRPMPGSVMLETLERSADFAADALPQMIVVP